MAILTFIVILAILVLVHEFGHFIVAKKSGIKVTEFGLGFPPRLWSITKGETTYSINAVPFGGFVKIFGENPDEESISGPENSRSIVNKNPFIQVAVLIAGVTFNVIFAWLLISIGFMSGLPTPSDGYEGPGTVKNIQLVITNTLPDSPASKAGIKPGDTILNVQSEQYETKSVTPEIVSNFIEAHGRNGVNLDILRGKEHISVPVKAVEGVVAGQFAIGVAMENIGTLQLPFQYALLQGGKATVNQFEEIGMGIFKFLRQVFVGQGNLSQVTGPVGIVGLVGDVTHLGFVYLLTFTAIISLNLAVINLLPFPALDGGRIVIVIIEAIIRRKISPNVVNIINGAGFVVLIGLMVVVTIHDVFKLF